MADAGDDAREFWAKTMKDGDGLGDLIRQLATNHAEQSIVGHNHGVPALSAPRTSTLMLGPPQSAKSSGYVIPSVLTAHGPVVSTSVRTDVAVATAMHRARIGRVWTFNPLVEPEPWAEQLRWSPVQGAEDWGVALRTTAALSRAEGDDRGRGGRQDDSYWATRAQDLIAPLLHYAALADFDIGFVVQFCSNGADYAKQPDPQTRKPRYEVVLSYLEQCGSYDAASSLRGVVTTGDREAGSIFGSASKVLRVFRFPGVLESVSNPNFDPKAFVRGNPSADRGGSLPDGEFDTIYLWSRERDQAMVSPIFEALVQEIAWAAYDLAEEDRLADSYGRARVNFVLDELSQVSIPDLDTIMATAAGSGINVVGCLQNYSQARARFGDDKARALISLFRNLVIERDIRDRELLDLLRDIAGEHDVEVVTRTYEGRRGRRPEGHSVTTRKESVLPISRIVAGPENPDEVWVFGPAGTWGQVGLNRYFAAPYWPAIIEQSCRQALMDPEIRKRGLPLPPLARGGDNSNLIAQEELTPGVNQRWFELEHGVATVGAAPVPAKAKVAGTTWWKRPWERIRKGRKLPALTPQQWAFVVVVDVLVPLAIGFWWNIGGVATVDNGVPNPDIVSDDRAQNFKQVFKGIFQIWFFLTVFLWLGTRKTLGRRLLELRPNNLDDKVAGWIDIGGPYLILVAQGFLFTNSSSFDDGLTEPGNNTIENVITLFWLGNGLLYLLSGRSVGGLLTRNKAPS